MKLHYGNIDSPCEDCPDRKPGCHDPEKCEKWAVFDAVKNTANAAAKKARDAERSAREFEIEGKVKAARRRGK